MLLIHGDHGHSGMASAAMCTIAQRSQSWATCDAPLTTGATGQRPGPSDKIANAYSVQNNQKAQGKNEKYVLLSLPDSKVPPLTSLQKPKSQNFEEGNRFIQVSPEEGRRLVNLKLTSWGGRLKRAKVAQGAGPGSTVLGRGFLPEPVSSLPELDLRPWSWTILSIFFLDKHSQVICAEERRPPESPSLQFRKPWERAGWFKSDEKSGRGQR